MSSRKTPTALELNLPVAVLRLWIDAGRAERIESLASMPDEGVTEAGKGIWIVRPSAGRPAVFDRAAALGGRLLAALGAEHGRGHVRALVLPALAAVRGDQIRVSEDLLLDQLSKPPSNLPTDALHLTTHASLALERRWRSRSAGQIQLESGRVVPIVSLDENAADHFPWRSPVVLTRTPAWVPRPELAEALAQQLTAPASRIAGPLGSGKTRLAWEVLRGAGRAAVWRSKGDSSAPEKRLDKVLEEDTRRPLWLVYDDLEAPPDGLREEVEASLTRPDLGRGVHLLLIGRSGGDGLTTTARLPELVVPLWEGEPWLRLREQLFEGLQLPEAVSEGLAAAAGGCPFALEESLVDLVRDRQLRQVFGSYFFSGDESSLRVRLSPRFRLHAEAEAERLGAATPLRLLGLVEEAVPAPELRAAAAALGDALDASWQTAVTVAGLAGSALGPWGEGLRPTHPALAHALSANLTDVGRRRCRGTLGELLAARSASADELWCAWPLVAGSDEGVRTVLAAARARGARDEVARYDALRSELAALVQRSGDPGLELDLLWTLLPLARRLGRLHELDDAIARGLELAKDSPERFVAIAAVAAELAQKAGRLRDAETVLRRALSTAREIDERRKELLVLELGRVLVQLGRRDEARDLFEKTRSIAERNEREGVAATCLFLLGNLSFHELDFAAARSLHLEALELRRPASLPGPASASLAALGALALAEGNFPEAIERYEEARARLDGTSSPTEEAWALVGLGRALLRVGDPSRALAVSRRALSLREGRDDTRGEAIARLAVAEALQHLGQLDNAHKEARKAHFALGLLPEGEASAEAESVLGRILLKQRRPTEAASRFAESERLYRLAGNELALPEVLASRLEAALAIGRNDAVRAAWDALATERRKRPQIVSGVICDYQLYHGADWLRTRKEEIEDPLPYLERAYAELMRETAFLAPEHRQRFLFQIPIHQAIVDAATHHGLSLPT